MLVLYVSVGNTRLEIHILVRKISKIQPPLSFEIKMYKMQPVKLLACGKKCSLW